MHRSERLNIILRLLLDNSEFTVTTLCKELGVSQRSLYRDLKLLKDQGYPIEGDVGRGGGIRLHRSYGLSKIQLSNEQAFGTLLSIAIAEKLGLPFFSDQLRPARQKISSAFAESQRAIVRQIQDRVYIGNPASSAVVSSYKSPNSKIAKVIECSFLNVRSIDIEYLDEKNCKTNRTIEPHGIFINFPAWYLIAFDKLRNAPRTFRLDRIKSAIILEGGFNPRAKELFDILVGSDFGARV